MTDRRALTNLAYQARHAADGIERLAAEQRELRRLYLALAATMAVSFLIAWAVCEVFTLVNAARIAGGW